MSATQIDHAADSLTSSHSRPEQPFVPNPVEVIRQCFEAFKQGDIPFFVGAVAEGCPWSGSMAPDIPYAGQFAGPSGAAEFFDALGRNLDVTSLDIERYIGDGEHVVVIGGWSGVSRNTGRHYNSRLALYFQVRNGKIVRFVGHEDTALMAAAVRA